jgi:predicted kinase
MIIIVFGLPGSGKSYFASKLAKKLQARYMNSDVIRNKLFAVKEYTQEKKMKVYDEMFREMIKAVQQNANIILDATFYRKSIRSKFSEAVKEFGQSIVFIEVWADQEIIKKRLSQKRPTSDADYAVHLEIRKVFEPMKREHLTLQSTQENIDEMMDVALTFIQNSHE